MTAQPVLLLDVDGVINVRPHTGGWDRPPVKANCKGLPIYWEPELGLRLHTIHDTGLAEIRWCTTWCGLDLQLTALGQLIGIDAQPAFRDRPMSKTWGDLKVEAALAVLVEDRPLVWVDDEEAAAARRLFPAIADAERKGRALLVEPASEHGLQPHHLDAIEAFCKEAQ